MVIAKIADKLEASNAELIRDFIASITPILKFYDDDLKRRISKTIMKLAQKIDDHDPQGFKTWDCESLYVPEPFERENLHLSATPRAG